MSKGLSKGPTEGQKIEVNKDSVNLSSQSILNIFAFGFFIKNNELTYAFNDSLSFIKTDGFILIDNFTLCENSSSKKINEIINEIKKMKKEDKIIIFYLALIELSFVFTADKTITIFIPGDSTPAPRDTSNDNQQSRQ
jgi:hypothetical protein